MDPTSADPQADRVECGASKDPAVRLFILAGMLILFGAWCFVEAYVQKKYPYPDPWNINEYINHALNHYGPFVFLPAGLAVVVAAVRSLRRRLVADGEGIGYAGKDKLRWEQVTKLDATRLKAKGILRLHHDGGKLLTLDSWKLKNFRELVAFVERHVPQERRVV